jgi:tetratricopeptide (TPR) repeat protein
MRERWRAAALTGTLIAGAAFADGGPGCDDALAKRETAVAAAPADLRVAAAYRQDAIRCGQVGRASRFLDALAKRHPRVANAWISAALAVIDDIPGRNNLKQGLLGRRASERLARALELERSDVAHYLRGRVGLFYPRVFGVAPRAIRDLEAALALQRAAAPRRYHALTYVTLGDAYHYRAGRRDEARALWREGLRRFPGHPELEARLARDGDALKKLIQRALDCDRRIDTSLRELDEG